MSGEAGAGRGATSGAVRALQAAHALFALVFVGVLVVAAVTKDAPRDVQDRNWVVYSGICLLAGTVMAVSFRVCPGRGGYVGTVLAYTAGAFMPIANVVVMVMAMPTGRRARAARERRAREGDPSLGAYLVGGKPGEGPLAPERVAMYRRQARHHRFLAAVFAVVIIVAVVIGRFLPDGASPVFVAVYLLAWAAGLVTMCRTWIAHGRKDAVLSVAWPALMGFFLLLPLVNVWALRITAPETVRLRPDEVTGAGA